MIWKSLNIAQTIILTFNIDRFIYLNKIESWPFIDSSFNDYFLNIFSKNCEIKSIPENILSAEIYDYNDELSNCNFTFETKLKYKGYKYLNVIKCGFQFYNLSVDEIQTESKLRSKLFYEKLIALDIPELRNKTKQIKSFFERNCSKYNFYENKMLWKQKDFLFIF